MGVNVWRALRDVDDEHPAWVHLHRKPLTEDDLPRHLDIQAAPGQALPAPLHTSSGPDSPGAVDLMTPPSSTCSSGVTEGAVAQMEEEFEAV